MTAAAVLRDTEGTMIVFLHGPDDWRRQQKKQELIKEFLKKNKTTGLREFDMQSSEAVGEFEVFTNNQSMFDPVRLAVIDNPLSGKEALAAPLQKLSESRTMTVIASEREKKIPKVFNFLTKKPVLSQEFAWLEGAPWKTFIKNQAKGVKLTLADDTLALLAQVYVNNTWGLVTELEKFSCLGKTTLTPADIAMFHLEVAQDFWKVLMGLRSPNRGMRMATLEKILATNEAPAKVFNILAAMWKEKTAQFARFDLLIKSGKLDYEEALLDLAIS